jgi:hypothetical protein
MNREPAIQFFCPERTQTRSSDHAQVGSKEARDEIEAYATIRDLLLSDAEVTNSVESLRRAAIANELLESCLRPPRSPWQAQYLEPREAARELDRCCATKMRIAALQQKFSTESTKVRLVTNE